MSKLRSTLIALIAASLLVPAAADAKATAHVALQECADADLEPAADNLGRIRDAILCLHNETRAEHRLPALRENKRLRRAALRHSRAMVANGFFEHTTPAGISMVDRIMRARYVRRDQGWALGENLAWGTGSLATPQAIMKAWMDSPGHRANVVKRAYREIGIGVVAGVPSDRDSGATYTADFGVIRR